MTTQQVLGYPKTTKQIKMSFSRLRQLNREERRLQTPQGIDRILNLCSQIREFIPLHGYEHAGLRVKEFMRTHTHTHIYLNITGKRTLRKTMK